MITVQNYSQKINSINWNKVPKEIASIKNDVDFSIEFYNDDDGIKETVDLFLKQANKVYNEQLKAEIEAGAVIDIDGTKVKETPKKPTKKEPKILVVKPSHGKNEDKSKVDLYFLKTLFKGDKVFKASFIAEGGQITQTDRLIYAGRYKEASAKRIAEIIDEDMPELIYKFEHVKTKNILISSKNQKPIKETTTKPKKTVAKKVDKKIVDNFSKEFMLIRRAFNMISKNEIVPFRKMQLLYAAFQKAAVGREVRKTSEDADLFTKVNKKIVAIYNIAEPKKFDVDIDFTDKALLSEMEDYSTGKKVNYAITLLNSFIGMQGTRPDIKKAANLIKRMDSAIDNKTIDSDNRLYKDILEAKKSLNDYILKPSEKIEAEIHGLSLPKRNLCKNRIKCAGLRNDGKLRKGYKFLTDGSVKKVSKSSPKIAKKKSKKIASKRKLGSVLIDINPTPPQAAIVVNEGATMAAAVDMAPQITTFQEEKQPEPVQPQKQPLKRVRNKIVQGITEAKLAAANVKLFNFSGPLAQFLGNLEKKHTHSVVITLDAPPGSGKTRALFQMVNMAANAGLTSVLFSLEEHPQSKLFSDKASLYIDAKNERLIDVVGELPPTYDEFIKIIEHYDFIGIDSWNKAFEFYGVDFDNDLRKRLNGKLIAAIFQRTQDGKMRGGAKASFDGDVILEVVKDDDFKNSYLQARKNRYQDTPLNEIGYNFYHKKLINPYQLNNFEVPTQMQI